MSTIREQIVSAAVTALTTGAPAGVPAPVRTRLDSPSADQLPALTVYQGVETVETMRDAKPGTASRGPIVRRSLLLSVEVLTKAGIGWRARQGGRPDPGLGDQGARRSRHLRRPGQSPADEVGTKFEYEQAETSFCRATQTFRIEYQTRTE